MNSYSSLGSTGAYWCVIGFISRNAIFPSILAILLFITFTVTSLLVRAEIAVTALHYYCNAAVRTFNAAGLIFTFTIVTFRRRLYIRSVRRFASRNYLSRNPCLIHALFVTAAAVYEVYIVSDLSAAYVSWYELHVSTSVTLAYHSCVYTLADKFLGLKFHTEKLWDTMREHAELCGLSRDIEKAFGPATLALISLKFVRMVLSSFYALEAAMAGQVFFATKETAHAVLAVSYVVVLACSCQRAKAASLRAHRFIYAAAHHQQDKHIVNELARAALQLRHNRAEFSAGGLVSIDGTLIFTMSGAATTYLVMLVQFAVAPRVQLATIDEFDPVNTTVMSTQCLDDL